MQAIGFLRELLPAKEKLASCKGTIGCADDYWNLAGMSWERCPALCMKM